LLNKTLTMPTSRPFAYNTGGNISGTIQVGSLAVGYPTTGFTGTEWWNGPDEELGFVIANPVPDDGQPTPVSGQTASVGFFRTNGFNDEEFLEIANILLNDNYTNAALASSDLTANGFWNSYVAPTPTPSPSPTPTPTITPTPTPTPESGVTFSQTFTSGASPGTTIENDWTTFRSQLTGTYTKFDFYSSNGQGYTGITDSIKVQQLATNLKNGTAVSVNIGGVQWLIGCCACRAGGATPNAVEFSNVASCSGGSTAALRPWIANANWGGIGTTVNAATQTLTLKFY